MREIIPAIIAQDKAELAHKLSLVEGLVSWAQIDVMDGVFVEPTTWQSPEDLRDIKTDINLEAHLMIANPENTIDAWLASSVRRILFHYESTTPETLKILIEKTVAAGKEAGIGLKLQTRLLVLDDLIPVLGEKLSVVQLMGIVEIGYYGHPFVKGMLGRTRALRGKYRHGTIEIDGGVTLENASALCRAGADRLVAGSAIFKSGDIKGAIEKFKEIINGASA